MKMNESFRLRVKDIDAHKLISSNFGPNSIRVREYVWIPKSTDIQRIKNATDVVVDNQDDQNGKAKVSHV